MLKSEDIIVRGVFLCFYFDSSKMDTSPTLSIGGSRARAALLTTSGTGSGGTDRRVVFLTSQTVDGNGHETKTWPHHWSPHTVSFSFLQVPRRRRLTKEIFTMNPSRNKEIVGDDSSIISIPMLYLSRRSMPHYYEFMVRCFPIIIPVKNLYYSKWFARSKWFDIEGTRMDPPWIRSKCISYGSRYRLLSTVSWNMTVIGDPFSYCDSPFGD